MAENNQLPESENLSTTTLKPGSSGDEQDGGEHHQEPSSTSSSSLPLDLNLDSLTIQENKGSDSDKVSTSSNGVESKLEEPSVPSIKDRIEQDDDQGSNIVVNSGNSLYSNAATFEDLHLSHDLLRGLYIEMNFTRPSKIQAVSLPMILTPPYKDLIAQAHNGAGKTTCFVLGMLSRVDPKLKAPQALCICPTRELAIQNLEVLRKMGKYTEVTSSRAISMDRSNGVPIGKRGPITDQVVIGTPGTMNRLVSSKKLSIRDLKILVFDEADHMLAEDGFKDDSLRIIKAIESSKRHCQVLLFSATFNDTVKNFALRVVKDSNQMFVKKEELTLDAVKQYKVHLPDELAKIQVIKDKIFELGAKLGQTIIFVHTKSSARNVHTTLEGYGYKCTTVHGSIDLVLRDKIVKEFKDGLTKVLISTDVLARGFDQSQVNLIVNYDLPFKHEFPSEPDYEVYLHRCGRAGRFGRKGAVFNLLCTDSEYMLMEKIEKHFGHQGAEVPNWQSEKDFEESLKAAGLL